MKMRYAASIVALLIAALTGAMAGSIAPRAAEPAAETEQSAPGESSDAAEKAQGPGDSDDAAESAGPGDDDSGDKPDANAGEESLEAAPPAADAKPEQAEPEKAETGNSGMEPEGAAAASEPADTAKDEPAAEPAQADQKADESGDPQGKHESAEAAQEQSPESLAAAEKVKAGDIPVPADKVALAAFDVLEKHCARCHQAGASLKRQKPAKNFGNILHLEEISTEPSLILPGNPDGSKLFIQIAKKEMPYDCYQEFDCKAEPTEDEVKAIYDWIKGLGAITVAACTGRQPIDEEAIVKAIADDLEHQQDHRRTGMRYITLSNFYNACTPETDMVRYRQGVVKLLNSLSDQSDVLRLRTIDPEKTIVSFNLDDLGWTDADWNRIISIYPYAMKPDTTAYDTVASVTGTPLAWVRGDWFAFTASRPPLYYDLLKMPADFAGLERQIDVDVKRNIEKFLAQRAGFQNSGVSKHNRLIERHPIATGYFWTSYDFKGDKPEQSLFVHPLGPDGADAFHHDGGETIFSLPNGFQAYYLNKATGERLDKGPTEIVLDDSQLDRAVTNGISCMGCHNQGIRQAVDDIRKHVLSDRTFSKEIRDQVEALYPEPEAFKALLDGDASRFRTAMLKAGLDPDLDSQKVGVESINFLSKAYERAIDLRIAAAEYGLAADVFAAGLANAGGESGQIKRRLEQGVLPRDILEANFKEIIVQVSDNEPIDVGAAGGLQVAKVGGKSKEETHDFDLALTSDRSDYKVDDIPVFTISSKEDCHLTLINVDVKGDGTVIFPNKFQEDNLLVAGKPTEIGGPNSKFKFRLKDPGTETVIAVCNANGKDVDGIKHDFKTRQFTELGNYRGFLTRQIVVEGQEKIAEGQKDKGKDKTPASDILSRTAIKLQVK